MRRFMVSSMACLFAFSGVALGLVEAPRAAAPANGPVAAPALAVRMAPIYERVGSAEAIVVGKVTELEKDKVDARAFAGAPQKSPYTVASVKIGKALRGAKGLTDLRVGFLKSVVIRQPIRGLPEPRLGRLRAIRPPYNTAPALAEGQEGLMFLKKHFEGDFYVLDGYQGFVSKDNPSFNKDVDLVRRCIKLVDKPIAGLKSKDASDRLLAAAMLIGRYRTVGPAMRPPYKTEPIDAEESKLILAALAETSWTEQNPQIGIQAWVLFNRLGLTAKDDWKPPQVFKNYIQEISDAGKAWLKQHGDSYRIQKYIGDK